MTDLSGKVALVTGAASGIGLAIARDFAQNNCSVTLADINAERGHAIASELPGARFQQTDLTRPDDITRLVEDTIAVSGKIDILVNNAGVQHVAPIHEFPEAKWRQIIDMMLTAPFLLTKAVLPGMYARKWGRIINMASIHGLVASPFKVAYISAKHGLIGLTRTTAAEAGDYGITCNAICPSYVRTPLVENQIADQARMHNMPEAEVVEKIMLAKAAIHQLLEPDEVAQFATYLCSDAARSITGSALTIDCGWTAM